MKKITLGLALMCSIFAHAATCTWNLAGIAPATEYGYTIDDIGYFTAYLIDENSVSATAMESALLGGANFESVKDTDDMTAKIIATATYGDGLVASGENMVATKGNIGSYLAGDKANYYTLIIDDKQSIFMITDPSGEKTVTTGNLMMMFGNATTKGYTWQSIPEPTSGLLLLVGGALLALRRKQK